MRDLVMHVRNEAVELHPAVSNFVDNLRTLHLYPHDKTETRWAELNHQLQHHRACLRSGNKIASRLRREDLIFLAFYRMLYPKAQADEINAFLYNANFGNVDFTFYSRSQITEAEKLIGLSRKAGSSTAYQAFLPMNIQKRWNYWNLPYPMGIADIPRRFMIDLDEAGIFIESVNRGHDKVYIGAHVNKPGPYSNKPYFLEFLGKMASVLYQTGHFCLEKRSSILISVLYDIN